jgi:hypothetical protein
MTGEKYLYRVRMSRDSGFGRGSCTPLEFLRREMVRQLERAVEAKAVMTVPRQSPSDREEFFEMEMFILTPAEMAAITGR